MFRTFNYPKSIRYRPRLRLAFVILLCLIIFSLTGCGFVQDFFGDEPEDQSLNTVGGKVSSQTDKPKPDKTTESAKSGDDKTAQPAEISEEEKKRATIQEIINRQNQKADSFQFNPEGMVDPFMPIDAVLVGKQEDGKTPPPPKKLPPLQRMQLSQLKLVAIVIAGENTRALVEDSAGTGYIIELGTKIGRNNGKVSEIERDKIVVEEEVTNYMGEKKTRKAMLKLHAIEGEEK